MPSLFESLGLAAAEAMSYGKPVVASNSGGLPEVVGNGGLIVPPKDAKRLADAINSLLGNDAVRRDMGMKARERAGPILMGPGGGQDGKDLRFAHIRTKVNEK